MAHLAYHVHKMCEVQYDNCDNKHTLNETSKI